ncbi:MAG: TonB C-terminal domain-containing protein, partial [Terriglobia bacterium]
MSAETFPLPFDHRDTLGGWLAASIAFHVAIVVVAVAYAWIGFHHGPGWGNPWAKGTATQVNVVSSLPGIPLPTPMEQTRSTLRDENPGLYKTLVQPREVPPPDALEIPKFKDAIHPKPVIRINKRIQKEAPLPPPNAIPFGNQGQAAIDYGQFVIGSSRGGIAIESGNFGTRYGWYVQAVKNRVSSNWLLSMISPNITSARRVYVEFKVQRDGTITDVKLTQS